MSELKTAQEWLDAVYPGSVVLAPDGWQQNDGVTWETPITRQEFDERFNISTVSLTWLDQRGEVK